MEKPYETAYLTGTEQKIPDSAIKIAFLEKTETFSKSRFRVMGFRHELGACGFLFNTILDYVTRFKHHFHDFNYVIKVKAVITMKTSIEHILSASHNLV